LPPTYNYPYKLHDRVPEERRVLALNDLVCFAFESCGVNPNVVADIEIREAI